MDKNFEKEKLALLARKTELHNKRLEHETQLAAINNLIRNSGMMSRERYGTSCNAQQKHKEAILAIRKEAANVQNDLRQIASLEYEHKVNTTTPSAEIPDADPAIVREIVSIRDHYQAFAADASRVSSMRTMAAEFALKLTGIIRRAVNG